MKSPFLSLAATLLLPSVPAIAEGYLAGKAEALPALEIGLGDSGFEKTNGDYNIVTGKGYSLKIKSTGKHECAIVGPAFFDNIYVRKVEVNKVEIKVSGLREIEMEDEGEADIFFVAIKPGDYSWSCRGLEEKGLTGKFTVK
jgi:uncharacterized cupredoxin-like copper-binding protein